MFWKRGAEPRPPGGDARVSHLLSRRSDEPLPGLRAYALVYRPDDGRLRLLRHCAAARERASGRRRADRSHRAPPVYPGIARGLIRQESLSAARPMAAEARPACARSANQPGEALAPVG